MLKPMYRNVAFLMLATSSTLWPFAVQPAYGQDAEPPKSLVVRVIDRILRDDEERDPTTISRGDFFCPIAPARPNEDPQIWHQQPVFVWQGILEKIAIRDTATDEVIWTYEPTAEETHVVYEGSPLRPSREYRWDIYDSVSAESPSFSTGFEMLPHASRQLVTNGLTVAEQTADTAEAIAIARANYFANRALFQDAIQALFAVESPTQEMIEAQEQLVETLCVSNNDTAPH